MIDYFSNYECESTSLLSGQTVPSFNLAVDSSTETTSNNNLFPLVKWDTVSAVATLSANIFSFQQHTISNINVFYFEVKVNASALVRDIF